MIGMQISVKPGTKRKFLKGLEDGDPLVKEVISNHIVLSGVDDFCSLMWRYYARQ